MQLNSYNYKPERFNFYGEGTRFYGVEIELTTPNVDPMRIATNLDGRKHGENRFLHIMHDGSVNNGFEIVTHPCTLDYWKETMYKKIDALIEDINTMDTTASIDDSCGLHIHVTKPTNRRIISSAHILVAMFWDDLIKLSRRKDLERVDRYASGYNDSIKLLMRRIKDGQSLNHYMALNETENTLEFRIFAGEIRPLFITCYLEIVALILELAENLDILEIMRDTLEIGTFISEKKYEYPALWVYASALDMLPFDPFVEDKDAKEFVVCGKTIYLP